MLWVGAFDIMLLTLDYQHYKQGERSAQKFQAQINSIRGGHPSQKAQPSPFLFEESVRLNIARVNMFVFLFIFASLEVFSGFDTLPHYATAYFQQLNRVVLILGHLISMTHTPSASQVRSIPYLSYFRRSSHPEPTP